MQKTRILKLSIFAALVLCTLPVFSAPTVNIDAPTITIDIDDTLFPLGPALALQLETELNGMFSILEGSEFTTAVTDLEDQTNEKLASFGSQKKLALGFGNANAYAAQSATLQGYQGYKLFSLMAGVMIGAQLPTFDPEEMMKIPEQIVDDPDLYAGAAPSLAFNLGIHAGPIFRIFSKDLGKKMDKFYFNIKYGSLHYVFKTEDDVGDVVFDTTNFGLGVNYQWIPRAPSFLWGFFMWRGVNFGSGILYQSNRATFSPSYLIVEDYTDPIAFDSYTGSVNYTLTVEPKIKLEISTSTFSIPLEATTSVQLLWLLNFNFGAGVDLVFGNTDIIAKAGSKATIDNISIVVDGFGSQDFDTNIEDGEISIDASTKSIPPSFLRPRLMAGIGTNFGPLKVDVPVYYYFNTGLAFGITFGIVW